MIDISKLKSDNLKDIVNPVNIFASLPNKNPKYDGYLRDVQTEVLKKWYDKRDKRENIIKMNTGSGKTTVSLLILQSCLNEKKGNAIYVVPDNYLIDQVVEEANSLGISITVDPNDYKFMTNKSILVISIQKLINGRSIFTSDKQIDNILIDDVHACLETAENQFRIVIDRNSFENLFDDVMRLFSTDLEKQYYLNYLNILDKSPESSSMLVPFWAVKEKSVELVDLIKKYINRPDFVSNSFALNLIGDILDMCNIVVTYNQIEISPDCIPIEKITSFDEAKRRIFVSATLKDDGSLINSFNLKDVDEIITPENAIDIGNRIILYPQLNNRKITDEDIKKYLKFKSEKMRIVVIVPSRIRSEFWKDIADNIIDKNNIEIIKGKTVGLDVIINRYHGIDLKDELCRILVIDGLPQSRSKYDEIKEMIMHNTSVSIKNKMQKIEQGMGRGVRSNQDYCGIVLMGYDLSSVIYGNGAVDNFSTTTLKQFQMSEELYDELKDKSLEEIMENIDLCVGKNEAWYEFCNEGLNDLKYNNTINYDAIEKKLYLAYRHANKRNFSDCVKCIQDVVNQECNDRIKGFYKMVLAKYVNFLNPDEAQQILSTAKDINSNVLFPINGYVCRKNVGTIHSQAKKIISYIKNECVTTSNYYCKLQLLISDLNFSINTHKKFETSLCDFANCIGFIGSMPEKELSKGPDVLWNLGNGKFYIIECKNESMAPIISKKDCGQLLNSYEWGKEEYGEENVTAIIVHPSFIFDKTSTPNQQFLVFTKENIEKFKDNLSSFSNAIKQIDISELREDELMKLLSSCKLTKENFKEEYLVKYKMETN